LAFQARGRREFVGELCIALAKAAALDGERAVKRLLLNETRAVNNRKITGCSQLNSLLPFCYPTAQDEAGQGSIKGLADAR
jgi:hypothetical protein